MNQIYNLAQTIAADKETIATLEKHLLNAKNILAAHENAMKRLTTVPKVIVSDKGIGAARGLVQEDKPARERITMDNYGDLAIAAGDKVDIVVGGDSDFDGGITYKVVSVDYRTKNTFLELTYDNCTASNWYWYGHSDEIYLIRTPEGSLNKQ